MSQLIPRQSPDVTEAVERRESLEEVIFEIDESGQDLTDYTDDAGQLKWELKKLKPMHKQVASLIAQGFKNVQVAAMVGVTPEYVSMLLRQPLVKSHIQSMNEVVGGRLEAMFEQSVDTIADVMKNGNHADRLKASRLQLEATKRIGRPDPNANLGASDVDRLTQLADRLLALQSGVRRGGTFNEDGTEVA